MGGVGVRFAPLFAVLRARLATLTGKKLAQTNLLSGDPVIRWIAAATSLYDLAKI